MAKQARSARGELIDFDLLAIKQSLALKPVPVGVDQRRKFVDEKDGIRTKTAKMSDALAMAFEAVQLSADAVDVPDEVVAPVVKSKKSK